MQPGPHPGAQPAALKVLPQQKVAAHACALEPLVMSFACKNNVTSQHSLRCDGLLSSRFPCTSEPGVTLQFRGRGLPNQYRNSLLAICLPYCSQCLSYRSPTGGSLARSDTAYFSNWKQNAELLNPTTLGLATSTSANKRTILKGAGCTTLSTRHALVLCFCWQPRQTRAERSVA